jgi:hypothetical protein
LEVGGLFALLDLDLDLCDGSVGLGEDGEGAGHCVLSDHDELMDDEEEGGEYATAGGPLPIPKRDASLQLEVSYSSIFKLRREAARLTYLNGQDRAPAVNLGSFVVAGDSRATQAHIDGNFGAKITKSLSFYPNSLACINCSVTKEHRRLGIPGSGLAFVLTGPEFSPLCGCKERGLS